MRNDTNLLDRLKSAGKNPFPACSDQGKPTFKIRKKLETNIPLSAGTYSAIRIGYNLIR